MNKLEYLSALEKALKNYPSNYRDDITSVIEEHFEYGISNGKSEEEIASQLGPIDDLIEPISQNDSTDYFEEISNKVAEKTKQLTTTILRNLNAWGCTLDFSTMGEPTIIDINKDFKNLFIGGNSLDVNLINGERNVSFYPLKNLKGEETKLNILWEMNKLKLDTDGGRLVISIPALEDLEIKLNTGDIDIQFDKLNKVNLRATTGDIVIEENDSKSIIVENTTGDISLISCNANNLKVDTKTGDLDIDYCKFEHADINGISGDIVILNSEIELLNCDNVSGDIELLEGKLKGKVKCISGDISLELQEPIPLVCHTASGDISNDSDFEASKETNYEIIFGIEKPQLEIETLSGDIDID